MDVYFQTEKRYITYVVRILEGYEHLGVVTTTDPAAGIARVRATSDTAATVREILQSLTIPLTLLPENIAAKTSQTKKDVVE